MTTEDCCAIFRPCSPDWLISGKSPTHRLTPAPPAARRSPANIYGTMKEIQYIKPSKNTLLFCKFTTKKGVQIQVLNL